MIVVTTNDFINENPCSSMSAFFRDIPLLLQGGWLTLQLSNKTTVTPNQKEPTLL